MPARAQPRRERDDAIVVLLDAIEIAAAPYRSPVLVPVGSGRCPCARSLAVVRDQSSSGSSPAGSGSLSAR